MASRVVVVMFGITPAPAGSTRESYTSHNISQDHPRACGEHHTPIIPSPLPFGITPAPAGST